MPKLRIGVAGARRAASFLAGLRAYGDLTTIAAVYEPDDAARTTFASRSGVAAVDHYDAILDHVDAVIVASPQQYHVPQAVAALERGVHVLSEVPAAVSLEQARRLLEATRTSNAIYMLAENYCYIRDNLIVTAMARAGTFGEIYFGEGEYLHEMKAWHANPEGQPTWRYYWQVGRAGHTYPTHSIGPLLQWFSDRVVAVSCVGSGRHTDPEHEIDDTVLVLCRTSQGALLNIRLDLLSNRPHLMDYYSLQGTLGAYESARVAGQGGWVYVEGRSPSVTWEPLESYAEAFLPERYRQPDPEAGHWGADTWPVRAFVEAVTRGEKPEIDVYAALDMTLPGIASEASFYQGGAWVAVPNPRTMDAGIGPEPGREAPLA
jgi:predicted dehydrogenase